MIVKQIFRKEPYGMGIRLENTIVEIAEEFSVENALTMKQY
jgi:hypothetical protein